MAKVYFIGAGPGDPELITVKAARVIGSAGVIIYAGSLVNREILRYARETARVYNSAGLTLEEILDIITGAVARGETVARIHSGDPSLYGAIREQMALLEQRGIPCQVIPGVSSFLAAAAALQRELTVPGASQTVIITRLEGRTAVPREEDLASLARHRSSMCIFLSVHMIENVVEKLLAGYPPETPAAVVAKASWPEEKVVRGDLRCIARLAREAGIDKTALIMVGDFLTAAGKRSRLYDKNFAHGCRGKRP